MLVNNLFYFLLDVQLRTLLWGRLLGRFFNPSNLFVDYLPKVYIYKDVFSDEYVTILISNMFS